MLTPSKVSARCPLRTYHIKPPSSPFTHPIALLLPL